MTDEMKMAKMADRLLVICFLLVLSALLIFFFLWAQIPADHKTKISHITYRGESVAIIYDGKVVYWADVQVGGE